MLDADGEGAQVGVAHDLVLDGAALEGRGVEQRRFEGLINSARRRVSAEDLRRFDDEVGPNAGVRARDAEEGGR